MQAIKTPKQSLTKTQHSLRVSLPLYPPCFAEGSSVLAHAKRLEVASPYSSSLRVWCTRCWWNVETFALLATTCSSSLSLPSLGSNTLALGSCLCDNRSKTRQRQAVVLSSKTPHKPCVLRVLCVSASLLRTSSHHALWLPRWGNVKGEGFFACYASTHAS